MIMKNLSSQLNEYAKRIYDNFIIFAGTHPDKIEMLAQAGSDRKYYRFYYGSKTLIGVFSDNHAENRSFFYFTRVFNSLKLNVPQLFYVSDDETVYFIEDLGDVSLFDLVMSDAKRDCFGGKGEGIGVENDLTSASTGLVFRCTPDRLVRQRLHVYV